MGHLLTVILVRDVNIGGVTTITSLLDRGPFKLDMKFGCLWNWISRTDSLLGVVKYERKPTILSRPSSFQCLAFLVDVMRTG